MKTVFIDKYFKVFLPFGLRLLRHASDQLTNPWRDLLNSLNNLNLGLIFQFWTVPKDVID